MNFVMFLSQAIRYATVFILGIAGVSINEKSGQLNMGIPGTLCLGVLGALLGAWGVTNGVALDSINPFLIILVPSLCGMGLAVLAGLLFSFFTVTLKCNQNVTGLVITTFSASLVAYFINTIPVTAIDGIAKAGEMIQHLFKGYESAGSFGKIFFSQSIFTYLAVIIAIVVSVVIAKTRIGLNLRACGENPAAADAVGVNVNRYRYVASIVSALLVGLGGVAFQMDYSSGLYNANNSFESLGWLALSLVILSNWKSWIGIFTGFGLAALSFLQYYIPGTTGAVGKILDIVPYFVAIIVLILTSIFNTKKVGAPSALGQTYFREDR